MTNSQRLHVEQKIALILNLSPRTIEKYLENIKMKLQVKTRSELIDKTISEQLKQQTSI